MSYYKTKELLDNFFSKYIECFSAKDDNFDIHTIIRRNACISFYQNVDLPKDNIEIYIVCQMSYGKGDVVNGIKTYNILNKVFPNTSLLVKDAKEANTIQKLYPKSTYKILYFDSIPKTVYSFKIFIACALPIYFERFDHIPGEKKYLFLDEYNGWRIKSDVVFEEVRVTDGTDDDVSMDDTSDTIKEKTTFEIPKICKFKHQSINKLSCDTCLNNEYYQTYTINGNIDQYIWNNNTQWTASTGFGLIQNSIPALVIHIVEENVGPINDDETNDEIHDFLKLTNNNYYFAYLSISPGYEKTIVYLERYINLMRHYDKKIRKHDEFTNFIVLDPTRYIYKEKTNLFFVNGDEVKIFDNKYIVENKKNMIRILYIKNIPHETMITLMRNSHPCIFLSGDQSMVEGISMHKQGFTKVIFYQIQKWKRNFTNEFHKIAKKILLVRSPLIALQKKIFSHEDKFVSIYDLGNSLNSNMERLIRESGQVYDYIIENYNIADMLIPMVYRMIYENKDIAHLTDTMVDKFISGKDFKKEYYQFGKTLKIIPQKKRKTNTKIKSKGKKQKVKQTQVC